MDFAFRGLFCFHRLQTIFNQIEAELHVAIGTINNAIEIESTPREFNVVFANINKNNTLRFR